MLVEFSARRGCFVNNKYKKTKACKAPSISAYKKAVKGFRKEFPYAKTFAPWNEVNHVSQPTYKKPKLAAKYCKAMKSVVQEVHDPRGRPARPAQHRQLPAQVPEGVEGQGPDLGPAQLQGRQPPQEQGHPARPARHQGPALADRDGRPGAVQDVGLQVLAVSAPPRRRSTCSSSPRSTSAIKRIYVYRWFGEPRSARFDAGLVGPNGADAPGPEAVQEEHQGPAPVAPLPPWLARGAR